MNNDQIADILANLSGQISREVADGAENLNASWVDQHGVILSVDQAKALVSFVTKARFKLKASIGADIRRRMASEMLCVMVKKDNYTYRAAAESAVGYVDALVEELNKDS